MPMPEEGEEMGDTEDYGDDLDGEFRAGVLEAFPDLSDEQVSALKAAINACVDARGEPPKGPVPKGKSGLAIIFGKPKKGG